MPHYHQSPLHEEMGGGGRDLRSGTKPHKGTIGRCGNELGDELSSTITITI